MPKKLGGGGDVGIKRGNDRGTKRQLAVQPHDIANRRIERPLARELRFRPVVFRPYPVSGTNCGPVNRLVIAKHPPLPVEFCPVVRVEEFLPDFREHREAIVVGQTTKKEVSVGGGREEEGGRLAWLRRKQRQKGVVGQSTTVSRSKQPQTR